MLAYNGLVRRRNRTQEAWSEIDVELKRRHDLIPNLVETVKGYAAHEQRDVRGGHRGPGGRRKRRRDRRSGQDRPGRERAQPDPPLPFRGGRELPAATGRGELRPTPGAADRDRGQDRVRPALLQHQRPGLQHRPPDLPPQPPGRRLRLPSGRLLRGRRGRPRRARGQLHQPGTGRDAPPSPPPAG